MELRKKAKLGFVASVSATFVMAATVTAEPITVVSWGGS